MLGGGGNSSLLSSSLSSLVLALLSENRATQPAVPFTFLPLRVIRVDSLTSPVFVQKPPKYILLNSNEYYSWSFAIAPVVKAAAFPTWITSEAAIPSSFFRKDGVQPCSKNIIVFIFVARNICHEACCNCSVRSRKLTDDFELQT